MAEYFGKYSSPMDREYFQPLSDAEKAPLVPMGQVGISASPFTDQLQALKTRIFQGASKVELGFMGRGKGSMQGGNTTPEMYSKEHRAAIKELASINRVELTTHATPNAGSLAGAGQEGFVDEARKQTLFEIQRAIDFAADVAGGGPVVIHTGEWQRPVNETKRFKGSDFSAYDFSAFTGKKEVEFVSLADEKTGAIQRYRKDIEIYEPEIKERYKTTGDGEIKIYEKDENGFVKVSEAKNYDKILKELKDEYKKKGAYDEKDKVFFVKGKNGETLKKTEEEMFIRKFLQAEYDKTRAESIRYNPEHDKRVLDHRRKEYDEMKKDVEKLEKGTPERRDAEIRLNMALQEVREAETHLQHTEEFNSLQAAQAKKQLENMDNLKPLETVGLKKTAETVAEAAAYAYKKEIDEGLKKPLYVAPENVFAEQYGSHPQELKRIIMESRETMAKYLLDNPKKFNVKSMEQAKKIAESHIKATFDIGHAYTWKKYYNGDEKDFNKWVMGQVDDLLKNKIIGHVHISDNFGYEDEHVTPGMGKVPIKEFVERVKKEKDIGINIEPAHQDFEALIGAWRLFGSPVTGLGGSRIDQWMEVQGSYFGKTKSPYFVFGEYAPSDEYRGNPFWTGIPLD